VTPRVGRAQVSGPGWLLVCSDGLWNYASEPKALAEQIAAAGSSDPHVIATHLVAFANAAGGQDNITATLARVGKNAEAAPAPVAAAGGETDG
jgi:serine/threonine protein phosphatase PrpC